mgnify:CR=1 FL=1
MITSGFELLKFSTYTLIDVAVIVAAWAHLYAARDSKYGWKEILSLVFMVVGISFLVFDIKNLHLLLQ